ncbi:hypothetical protein JCM3770_005209 [Rhodotorula araucariae]
MAKKGRNGAAEPTAATPVLSRDSLQRLSFLYQASAILNNALQPRPVKRTRAAGTAVRGAAVGKGGAQGDTETSVVVELGAAEAKGEGSSAGTRAGNARADETQVPKKRRRKTDDLLKPLARHLAREMGEVAKKATVRMDPSVKRTLCSGCGTVLIPGVSSSHRGRMGTSSSITASLAESNLPTIPRTKREKREARQAQVPVFFEREGHVVVCGGAVVDRNEYREP